MTFIELLKQGYERGIIDWHIRVQSVDGLPKFYIHAAGHGSPTLDFAVDTPVVGHEQLIPSMYNDQAEWPRDIAPTSVASSIRSKQ